MINNDKNSHSDCSTIKNLDVNLVKANTTKEVNIHVMKHN